MTVQCQQQAHQKPAHLLVAARILFVLVLLALTSAARINGYAGHNGSLEQLESEIDSLGLSETAQQQLIEIMSARVDPSSQATTEH